MNRLHINVAVVATLKMFVSSKEDMRHKIWTGTIYGIAVTS